MNDPWGGLPLLTSDLPGTGGLVRAEPDDFEVEELPAYRPSGRGTHLFLWVEKRGRNTRDVAKELARALGVTERDVGWAGLKDRRALTRQFLSLPARPGQPSAEGLSGEGWRVLAATLHENKLRPGHLKGNRFRIRVRSCVEGALGKAEAIARALCQRGLPNAFGPQRFGRDGANSQLGCAMVKGTDAPGLERARRDRFQRRMAVSAWQASLFNRILTRRIQDGLFARALEGDLMKKRSTGGLFHCTEPAVDSPRVESFEISPTGPIFGHRMMEAKGEESSREAAVLTEEGISLESFRPLGGDAEGTRRPLRLPISVAAEEDPAGLLLSFELDAGSYATVVLREITKAGDAPDLPGEE